MKFCNLGIRREMSAVELKSALGEFRLYTLELRLNICESDCSTFFAD